MGSIEICISKILTSTLVWNCSSFSTVLSGGLRSSCFDELPLDVLATTGFDVTWVELGHSNSAQITSWIDQYDGIDTADFINGQNSYISDQEINDWAEHRLDDDLDGDGNIGLAADNRVAFLESRKAAAALGATAEWNKMEGVVFNENAPEYLYLAMSDIRYDMTCLLYTSPSPRDS